MRFFFSKLFINLINFFFREAKLHAHPKDLVEAISDFGEVVLIRTNSNGTKVSLTIANSNLIPSSYIYVWDIESDKMINYQFDDNDQQSTGLVLSVIAG